MNNYDFKEEYKKKIITTLNYTNLSITDLVFINRCIKYLKRKEYDIIVDEILDYKVVDLLSNKLDRVFYEKGN